MKPGVSETEDTKKSFADFANQRLSPCKVPREIEFGKELPTALAGKVLRRPLREEEKKQTGKS